jgi:homoserine O-acetyltransferase/O-succinyltransferase
MTTGGSIKHDADKGSPPLPDRKGGVFVIRDFTFRSGEVMAELRLGYTTLGAPRRDSSGSIVNSVLLLHGTTGTGISWLQPSLADSLFGTNQPLDAGKYYIILPDNIGLGRSSKPSDGLKAGFPHYGYHDMVETQHRLVTEGLGITRLRLVSGTSMGGMHTWLWAVRYSPMMDGAVALTSQPAAISGRNLLWRRIITEAIRNDPDWRGGDYTTNPTRFAYTFPLFSIMVDSAGHLQEICPTRETTLAYYDRMVENARRVDANDYLYRFEASADYDPWPDLERITVKLLAINFADDMINPTEPGILEQAMTRVKTGRSVLITPEKGKSLGHQNQSEGALWGPYLAEFLKELP